MFYTMKFISKPRLCGMMTAVFFRYIVSTRSVATGRKTLQNNSIRQTIQLCVGGPLPLKVIVIGLQKQ